MKSLILTRESLVWLVLMCLTALSWWLGADSGAEHNEVASGTAVFLMIVAFIKVRLVIQHFMELRDAPWILRGLSEAWVVLTCGSVLTIMLLG